MQERRYPYNNGFFYNVRTHSWEIANGQPVSEEVVIESFRQGDTVLWHNQPVTVEEVYTDGQTGLPFYRISDSTGQLFQPAGYTFAGASEVSQCPASAAPLVPDVPSFQFGYDALAQLYPMNGWLRLTVSFPTRTFFGFNPVSVLRWQNDQLLPCSRSFMSCQGAGKDVYEMATVDLLEGDYLEVRLSAVKRVVFVLTNGQLLEYLREGNVVVGVLPGM